MTLAARSGLAQSAPQAVSIAVDSNSHTYLLWNNPDGSSSLWNLDASGSPTGSYDYGPYTDNTVGSNPSVNKWKAIAVSTASDGTIHLLWNNTDRRAMFWNVLWSVNGGTGAFSVVGGFGPYTDDSVGNNPSVNLWNATALSTGPDGNSHFLWNNTDYRVMLWTLDNSGDFTLAGYGPYTDQTAQQLWSAAAVSTGPDNTTHLLWNNTDGRVMLWNVDSSFNFTLAGFGPYTDNAPQNLWSATALATGADGKSRIVWNNTDGRVMLWSVDSAFNFGLYGYGPFAGWSARAVAVGPDNLARVLWDGPNGSAQVWVVNADGTYTSTTYFTAPTNLIATPGDGTVSLDWDAPTVGGDSYNLYRGTSPGAEGPLPIKKGLNSTPYQDTGLADGTTYYYQVSAVTGKREGPLSAEVSVTPQPPPAPPASRLTQAQAVSLAQAFCQAVGAPVTATATAVWPAPNPYAGQPPYHWQNRWDIQFGTQADVEVVDATGVISHYYNFALSQQLMNANAPAGTPISESSAVQAAASALQASGQSGELASTPTDQNFQITDPPTQAGDLWMVTWGRQYQNIPYRQQQATVMLQAETGALQAFSLTFPSPPPGAGPGAITSSQAVQTAQTTLANAGYSNLTQQSVTLQAIQPNNQWHVGDYPGFVKFGPTPARVAWNCVFTDANSTVYEVWVDSTYQTNNIDGGEVYGIAGLPRRVAARRAAKPRTKPHAKMTAPKRKTQKIN